MCVCVFLTLAETEHNLVLFCHCSTAATLLTDTERDFFGDFCWQNCADTNSGILRIESVGGAGGGVGGAGFMTRICSVTRVFVFQHYPQGQISTAHTGDAKKCQTCIQILMTKINFKSIEKGHVSQTALFCTL